MVEISNMSQIIEWVHYLDPYMYNLRECNVFDFDF